MGSSFQNYRESNARRGAQFHKTLLRISDITSEAG
jgi:hypothetical protein